MNYRETYRDTKEHATAIYKAEVKRFYNAPTMEKSIYISKLADRLHNIFNISYQEIEEMEKER